MANQQYKPVFSRDSATDNRQRWSQAPLHARIGEIDTATAFGTLPSVVAPDQRRVPLPIVREEVIRGDAGIFSFERADVERHITSYHVVRIPFSDDLDIQRFLCRIVALPQVRHILRDIVGSFVGSEGLARKERKCEQVQNHKQSRFHHQHSLFISAFGCSQTH